VNSTAKSILFLGFYLHLPHGALEHVVEEHGGGKDAEISYSDLYNQVKQGKVAGRRGPGPGVARPHEGHAKEQFHTPCRRPTSKDLRRRS